MIPRRYREHTSHYVEFVANVSFAKIMLFLFSAAYLSKKFNQRLLLAFVGHIHL